MKNSFYFFERLFTVKKNGIFFFVISYVLEIHELTFLYYAN